MTQHERYFCIGSVEPVPDLAAAEPVVTCADCRGACAHRVRTAKNAFDAGRGAYAAGIFHKARRLFGEVLADDPNDRAAAYFHERAIAMERVTIAQSWDGVERMETK